MIKLRGESMIYPAHCPVIYAGPEASNTDLEAKYHIKGIPGEPRGCVGVLGHGQGLSTDSKDESSDLHEDCGVVKCA
ncbi:Major facilitator superfamily domaincontaining protein 1like [Caligus rogercresseyi]|uniref:Major facilitator superfamily domaincontaining protein 1like n=1 Tax=Caligus rogercresseyi TaxID=217165 RepID=A0A7T8JXQ2_CALRO|nr:Major facilitator superfamily domaincontaining protein 1like [Caligus rogercresseyi]